ncbi:MAG: penicillin acylase family protein, partial [Acidimicrobiia bacterium]|nr:penicillin acylase family protein [Acidimicrobiia bacterium]
MPTARGFGAVLAFVVLVAACSSSNDGESSSSTTAPPGPSDDVAATSTTSGDASSDAYQATITRTEHNVPHISAADMGSLGFGYGYAFAEDHACTLADIVLTGRSERARFFGEDELPSDVVYGALGTYERASADFDAYDDDIKDTIRGYAAGYNAYLDETGADNVPGWCAGEEWVRPIDEYDLAAYYRVVIGRASIEPTIDFIYSAEPPGSADGGDPTTTTSLDDLVPETTTAGSNAWGIGPDRTADGTTMLVGNPHFPWQGALRFYEVHLTVPGELDVYGASLLGTPAVLIGFTEGVAWSHTVSAGSRFTAYTLDLVEGDPTAYV